MRDFFCQLADVAAAASLPLFRNGLAVENKLSEGFDPVTEADKATERVIRDMIAQHYPDDGILGEEYGATNEDAARCWVIDPIDGTRAYITGIPIWGTLVGLLDGGRAVAGMMSQPYVEEIFYGDREGSVLMRHGVMTPLKVSTCMQLPHAKVMSSGPDFWTPQERGALDGIVDAARLMRYGADCYAFAMLAAGEVDVVVECGLQPHDICGLIPVIEGAGGVVANPQGNRVEGGGTVIAAATAELFEDVAQFWR